MHTAFKLELQVVSAQTNLPDQANFNAWVTAALEHLKVASLELVNLCIRIVDLEEMVELNKNYRNIDGSTNVLSFPHSLPEYLIDLTDDKPLGDIVLCAPIVEREACEQDKEVIAHWAHLTVHGVLHLLDYDHENDKEATQMEGFEIAILEKLGFANPY